MIKDIIINLIIHAFFILVYIVIDILIDDVIQPSAILTILICSTIYWGGLFFKRWRQNMEIKRRNLNKIIEQERGGEDEIQN